jgi:hypothetical protein
VALVTVPVHGEILDLDGLTPAVGTVTFRTLIELNDVVANITYPPADFVATLDLNGEFTINLPTTDNPDIVPLNWVYQVFISTTTYRQTIYVQIPFSVGVIEFADLARLDYDPCAGVFGNSPTPPGDLFVRKTGDTMTGPLIINSTLTVNGSASAQYGPNFHVDLAKSLSSVMSTGTLWGGEIAVNAGNPQAIDIAQGFGWVIDSYTVPSAPTFTGVTITPQTVALNPAALLRVITWWVIDSTGAVIQQAARPTATQRRSHLVLGVTAYNAGLLSIFVDQSLPVILSQPANQFIDLMDALAPFSITGNVVTPNGANLQINRTAGTVFANAVNFFPTGQTNPHVSPTAAQTPATLRRLTQVAQFPAPPVVNTIDAAQWDNGGVLTPVIGNDATVQRVWLFPANAAADQLAIQYGQQTFASFAAARDSFGQGDYITNPTVIQNAALIGYIIVAGNATALNNPAQALIRVSGKFDRP